MGGGNPHSPGRLPHRQGYHEERLPKMKSDPGAFLEEPAGFVSRRSIIHGAHRSPPEKLNLVGLNWEPWHAFPARSTHVITPVIPDSN